MVVDVLLVVRDRAFFACEQEKKSVRITDVLGKSYPRSLRAYVGRVSEEVCLQQIEEMASRLGSDSSLFQDVPKLGEKNDLFLACLDVLKTDLLKNLTSAVEQRSFFGRYCAHIVRGGALYERAFIREVQELLLYAGQGDSPLIQIAADLSESEKQEILCAVPMPGIPAIQVHRELLGGVRQFYNGTMQDDSWRARLIRVLNVVT